MRFQLIFGLWAPSCLLAQTCQVVKLDESLFWEREIYKKKVPNFYKKFGKSYNYIFFNKKPKNQENFQFSHFLPIQPVTISSGGILLRPDVACHVILLISNEKMTFLKRMRGDGFKLVTPHHHKTFMTFPLVYFIYLLCIYYYFYCYFN